MSPAELCDILARLGLSQVRAAHLFGVHKSTMQRWVKGEREIPKIVARLLFLAQIGEFNLELLDPDL